MNPLRPSFIGIGAQKCATSWVYRVLDEHPDICLADPKELDFFSYHYDHGYHWYEQHFSGCKSARATGEVSPSYFCCPAAPERAYRYNAALRIIISLRDPVERAYSNHLHEVRAGHLPDGESGFEAGLANNPMYVDQSMYYRNISRWLDVFPAGQVIVLFQEHIASDPGTQARRLYEFLGVDHEFRPSWAGRRANESQVAKSRLLAGGLKGIAGIFRKTGLGPLVDYIKHGSLGSFLIRANSRNIREIVPPLGEDTRAALEARFSEECARLKNLLGVDPLPWE